MILAQDFLQVALRISTFQQAVEFAPDPRMIDSSSSRARARSSCILQRHVHLISSKRLTKRERKGLNARIKEFDLKSPVFYQALLPDELIETGLSNLASAVRGGIDSAIITWGGSVQCHLKPNGLTVLHRA